MPGWLFSRSRVGTWRGIDSSCVLDPLLWPPIGCFLRRDPQGVEGLRANPAQNRPRDRFWPRYRPWNLSGPHLDWGRSPAQLSNGGNHRHRQTLAGEFGNFTVFLSTVFLFAVCVVLRQPVLATPVDHAEGEQEYTVLEPILNQFRVFVPPSRYFVLQIDVVHVDEEVKRLVITRSNPDCGVLIETEVVPLASPNRSDIGHTQELGPWGLRRTARWFGGRVRLDFNTEGRSERRVSRGIHHFGDHTE